jgi:hypothetical protein
VWFFGAVLLVIAAIAGGYFLYGFVADPYRTLTPLDVPAYLDDSNSLRGIVYKLSGTVASKLAWSPAVGSLYSVEVESTGEVLPLLVPAQFNHVNIQKGQRFFFRVEVGEKGILRVQELKKV